MTDSQPQAWLDQEDEHVAQTIRKYGLFIQLGSHDPGDSPPAFAYTVGLFGLDDRQGRFPWDPGYSNSLVLQPRPGTWRA
jgi:hypothetical protein